MKALKVEQLVIGAKFTFLPAMYKRLGKGKIDTTLIGIDNDWYIFQLADKRDWKINKLSFANIAKRDNWSLAE